MRVDWCVSSWFRIKNTHSLGAREPDLFVSRTAFISLCVVEPGLNIPVLLPSQTVTPLSPGRGGARTGAAGVRRVCGMSVGPRAICHVRLALFHNIEG